MRGGSNSTSHKIRAKLAELEIVPGQPVMRAATAHTHLSNILRNEGAFFTLYNIGHFAQLLIDYRLFNQSDTIAQLLRQTKRCLQNTKQVPVYLLADLLRSLSQIHDHPRTIRSFKRDFVQAKLQHDLLEAEQLTARDVSSSYLAVLQTGYHNFDARMVRGLLERILTQLQTSLNRGGADTTILLQTFADTSVWHNAGGNFADRAHKTLETALVATYEQNRKFSGASQYAINKAIELSNALATLSQNPIQAYHHEHRSLFDDLANALIDNSARDLAPSLLAKTTHTFSTLNAASDELLSTLVGGFVETIDSQNLSDVALMYGVAAREVSPSDVWQPFHFAAEQQIASNLATMDAPELITIAVALSVFGISQEHMEDIARILNRYSDKVGDTDLMQLHHAYFGTSVSLSDRLSERIEQTLVRSKEAERPQLNDFERLVASELKNLDYAVVEQDYCEGYNIGLVVLLGEDQSQKIAVECDDVQHNYRCSVPDKESLRGNGRLRERVLSAAGDYAKVVRITSHDWTQQKNRVQWLKELLQG